MKGGIPAGKLANLPSYRDNPHFSERDQTALEFCERTTRDDLEVTDECLARVRKHFSEPELVELTLIAGFQIFPSRFAKAFLIAPQGFSAPSSRGCPRAPHGRSISRAWWKRRGKTGMQTSPPPRMFPFVPRYNVVPRESSRLPFATAGSD